MDEDGKSRVAWAAGLSVFQLDMVLRSFRSEGFDIVPTATMKRVVLELQEINASCDGFAYMEPVDCAAIGYRPRE